MKLSCRKYCLYFILIVLLFSQCDKLKWNLPKVQQNKNSNHPTLSITTSIPSNITKTTVTSGGTILNNGGLQITLSGLICGLSTNPSFNSGYLFLTTDGTDTGSYTSTITGLSPGTTYYLRAYAINNVDTAYGNQLTVTTYTHNIGDTFGGGIVFYVNSTGLHGLIAAISDQSTSAQWDNNFINFQTYANDTGIGTGLANTDLIITVQGSGTYAASICRSYNGGGFNDWYLPSLDELSMLVGIFPNDTAYWSSSQLLDAYYDMAWATGFSGGSVLINTSSFQLVRAIRSF